jgi:hypothetical protein
VTAPAKHAGGATCERGPRSIVVDRDCGTPVTVSGGVTGDQIWDACRTVLVGEALCDAKKRKRDAFHIHRDRFHRLQVQGVHSLVPPLRCGVHTQRHGAIAVAWHDDLLREGACDTMHVFRSSIPDIMEHLSAQNLVVHDVLQEVAGHIMLGCVRPSCFCSVFGIRGAFGVVRTNANSTGSAIPWR